MKKLLSVFFFLPIVTFSQAPAGYYDAANGLTGYALKSKLHDIISAKTISWHYGNLQTIYKQTDLDHYYDYDQSNDTYLLDIYSNNPTGTTAYHYTSDQMIGSANAEGLGWNREHQMPQSSFNSNYPMYSDLFFVIPTDARINQLRSNYPYGISTTTPSYVYHTFTNGSKIGRNATPNSGYTGRVYEPHDEFKGDVARSLLYFALRYEGKLNSFNFYNGTSPANDTSPLDGTEEKAFEDWYIALLLQWHHQDPVSPREIERNNAVFAVQKNRNPFIDHPEWVNQIWQQTAVTTIPSMPTGLNADQVNANFVSLSWNPVNEAGILGYKIYVNGNYLGYTKDHHFVVDQLSPSTTYSISVKAYNTGYLESAESNIVNVTTLATDNFATDLMITKYIEGSGNNKAIEITNKTGHAINLNKYRLSIQFYSGSNYYFPAPFELEGTIEANETIVVLNPNANLSCIKNDQARFVTAAPQLTFDGSNYIELRYMSTTVDAIGTKGVNNFSSLGNLSLYRRSDINQPNKTFSISEWETHSTDYCEGIGSLAASEVNANTNSDLLIYPNPVVGNFLYVKMTKLVQAHSAVIYDMSGKVMKSEFKPFKNKNFINVDVLPSGVYTISIDGKTAKFIKK